MKVERVTVRLPDGFDSARHIKALASSISERYGEGFEIDSIDVDGRVAYATRQSQVVEVSVGKSSITVHLPRGTKAGDGERVAAKMAEQNPGYQMTSFEPHVGRATLTKMDERTFRARAAIAVALGVKPWDVKIAPRPDEGFDIVLPQNYVPSKHDDKLDEVATAIVGRLGWYVSINPQTLRGSILPGDPPTFPVVQPYPFRDGDGRLVLDDDEWSHIPLGRTLGQPGGDEGPELFTDMVLAPHMQISGLTGGGKGFSLMAMMTGALARGWELCIIDAVKGGIDFIEWQPFTRDDGWGDNLASACCVIALVYKEGLRRKKIVQSYGVQKWTQLPKSEKVKPLMLVVDELTSLIMPEPTPKGVPKDNPLALEVAERNLMKATILNNLGKIARELRFAGISLVASTQVASTTTGVPTELRANLGAKLLLGSKPTENNRRLALNDPDAVPRVPLNIVDSPNGESRGVGVYEFEGQKPGVVKVYFATPKEYATWLDRLGIPHSKNPRPTAATISANTPSLESDDGGGGADESWQSPRVKPQPPVVDEVTGEVLKGFDRANEIRRKLEVAAKPVDSVPETPRA
jgi:hypothetical protein